MSLLKKIVNSAVVKLAGGVALGNIINLMFAPIMTYYYSPESYGQYALFLMFITVGNAINTLKLEQLSMNEASILNRSYNLQSALFISILISFVLSLMYVVLAYFGWFGFQNMPLYFGVIIFFVLLGVAGYVYFRYFNLKNKKYKKLGWLESYKAIGRVGIQILFGFLGFKSVGLVLGEMGGRFFGIFSLISGNKPIIYYSIKEYSFRNVFNYLKKHKSFFLFATSSSLINVLNVTLLIPTLSYLYGEELTGKYSFVYRILSVPITLVGASLADVIHEKVSNNINSVEETFNKYSKLLFLVSLCIFIPTFFLVEPIADKLLDKRWSGVGEISKILLPWFFGILTVSSLSRILFVIRKEKLKFIYDLFSLVSLGFVFLLAYFNKWEWRLFLSVVTFTWVLNYLVYYFTIRFAVKSFKIGQLKEL